MSGESLIPGMVRSAMMHITITTFEVQCVMSNSTVVSRCWLLSMLVAVRCVCVEGGGAGVRRPVIQSSSHPIITLRQNQHKCLRKATTITIAVFMITMMHIQCIKCRILSAGEVALLTTVSPNPVRTRVQAGG